MAEVILEMQGIQKYFAGVHALKNVQFQLKKGEVHALMGENGAAGGQGCYQRRSHQRRMVGLHQRGRYDFQEPNILLKKGVVG